MSQDFAKITRLVDTVAVDLTTALGAVAAWTGAGPSPELRKAAEAQVNACVDDFRRHLQLLIQTVAFGSPQEAEAAEPASPAPEVVERRRCIPLDDAGNVLEARAESAPREPDGWLVVDGRGWSEGAWTRGETDYPEKRAKNLAAECGAGYTARPFYLDTPRSDAFAERDLEVARLQGLVDSLSAELAVASEAVVAYEQMRLAGIREIETLAPMWATRLREAFKAPTSPRPTTEGAR